MRFAYGIPGDAPSDIVLSLASAADERQLESFWINYPRRNPDADGLTRLIEVTEVTSKIELGIGIVPLSVRDASSIVEFTKVNSADSSRWMLGVGSGNVIKGSLDLVRSSIAEVREGIGCKVIVSALGQRMCTLAGELADGVIFNWVTPASAKQCSEWVQAGADAAGRDRPTCYSYIRFAVGEGREDRILTESASYWKTHGEQFEKLGATPFDASISVERGDQLVERAQAWNDGLDVMILRPLVAEESVAAHLEVLDAIALS